MPLSQFNVVYAITSDGSEAVYTEFGHRLFSLATEGTEDTKKKLSESLCSPWLFLFCLLVYEPKYDDQNDHAQD